MEINYEKDMKIDESALDVEWLDQGPLAQRYGKLVKDVWLEWKLAEEEVKTIRSELVLEANEQPEKLLKKAKPNAADIEAFYRTNRKYIEAKERALELESDYMYAEHVKDQICWTRRATLENLVKLHGQMWFAGPKVPRDLTTIMKERKEANDAIISRLKQRRKRE